MALPVWTLKKDALKRFQTGHPWVFSNELEGSPRGIQPGELVELRDREGHFLARGYGHPSTLIAFRVLSRVKREDVTTPDFFWGRLEAARKYRQDMGLAGDSYRLCFAEADGLPGLIVERFATSSGQVFVIQSQTAGMDRLLADPLPVFQRLAGSDWDKTAVILKNDAGARALEGLKQEDAKILHPGAGLGPVKIGGQIFDVDLVDGQKTGFFLDQALNIQQLLKFLPAEPLKVLDLFTYVGQWSTHIGAARPDSDFTVADASASALELATRNVARVLKTGQVHAVKTDLVEKFANVGEGPFDVVICDPPALIKSRKELPQGRHAYLKLNMESLKVTRTGGLFVTCSCSHLMNEGDFEDMLLKAMSRAGVQVQWLFHGSQSPDHPVRLEFPQGRYLKAWIGRVTRLS